MRIDAVVTESFEEPEHGLGRDGLVDPGVDDLHDDGDTLAGRDHSELTSVTAARAALSSTMEAPSA